MPHARSTPNAPTSGLRTLDVRIPTIDGLRGIAILLVFLDHVPHFEPPWDHYADGIAFRALESMWCGVDLFFVLSGFLITGILVDSKGEPGYFRKFYARRALRILPLYYAVLAILVIALPRLRGVNSNVVFPGQVWFWTYLANYRLAALATITPATGHLWSLAIEEQFYLVWPLIVFALSRRRLAIVAISIMVASLALRATMVLAHVSWVPIFVLTPTRIDAIAAGSLLALIARRTDGMSLIARWAKPVGIAAALGLLAIAALRRTLSNQDPLVLSIGLTLFSICFAALLGATLASSAQSRLARAMRNPLLIEFGRYSYAIYLFHFPLNFVAHRFGVWSDRVPRIDGWQLPGQIVYTTLAALFVLALATLSWHAYEKQWLKLKRFFQYRGEPTPRSESESLRAEGEAFAAP